MTASYDSAVAVCHLPLTTVTRHIAATVIALVLTVGARGQAVPVTGVEVPELAAFDSEVAALMSRHDIPGGALAISRRGRVVLVRGYGFAELDADRRVQPWTPFRLASVSKPITAAAVLRLHEQGRLNIDGYAVDYLRDLMPIGRPRDPRVERITIRHLLQHSAGWDAEAAGVDMQFDSWTIARTLDVAAPPTADDIVRYALDQPLQFDPGQRYAYANVGYTVLGRIIERVTGQPYEVFVREQVLAPAGIRCMRTGGTLQRDAARGEAHYYDYDGAPLAQSIYDEAQQVPWPYGGFDMRALAAAGGWVGSIVELIRFLDVVDGGTSRPDVLAAATVQLMTARPGPPLWVGSSAYYGLGWMVRGGLGASAT